MIHVFPRWSFGYLLGKLNQNHKAYHEVIYGIAYNLKCLLNRLSGMGN
ncbi:MAG: Uncharacterised protein [Cryomorphaceae bacterium]|nr:MAG: Uncharacterised protein [Cryomorphaceae bacterium]